MNRAPESSFYDGRPCRHGHGTRRYKAGSCCVVCSSEKSKARWDRDEWRKQRREKYATPEGRIDRRNRNLQRNYGITLEEFNAIALSQDFKCDLCGDRAAKVVDHCHKSGRNRSLLCVSCNLGLGNFRDDPGILTKAIAYLRKHGD